MKVLITVVLVLAVGTVAFSQQTEGRILPPVVSVAVLVPDGGWSITITEAREVSGEVWVLAQLKKAPGMSIQALRTVKDSIELDPEGRVVRVLVTGKAWNWPSKEPYYFLDGTPVAKQKLALFRAGDKLFPKP